MKFALTISLQCAAALVFSLGADLSLAQPFPSKPVRLIVPYAPGGSAETTARIIGEMMSQEWKQPVVVQNRPGASGMTGAAAAGRSAGDGYTLVAVTQGTLAFNPHLYSRAELGTTRSTASRRSRAFPRVR